MSEKHTPTPWCVEFHPGRYGGPATLIMQAGAEMYDKWIAECLHGRDGGDNEDGDGVRDCTAAEAQANARLIVRAVNAHDELLAELEAVAFWLDERAEFLLDLTGDLSGQVQAVRNEVVRHRNRAALVRQAIAKAKGE